MCLLNLLKNRKKIIFILIIIFALIILLYLTGSFRKFRYAILGETEIKIELAEKEAEKYQGLSGRDELCQNCGMLFMYDDCKQRNFVMRNMKFNLDIIWIAGSKIVQIDKNLPAEGESPNVIYSSYIPVDTVLEVNAGFCDKNNIRVGDKIMPH